METVSIINLQNDQKNDSNDPPHKKIIDLKKYDTNFVYTSQNREMYSSIDLT